MRAPPDGVGQIPMSAGETLETELIDTERAAPHTRFPHVEASAFDRILSDGFLASLA